MLLKLSFKATQLQKMPECDIFQRALFCILASSMNLGTKRCFSYNRAVFMKRFYFHPLKTDHFGSFNAFLNKQKLKGKFSDNLGQNICRLFHFLAPFVLTMMMMTNCFVVWLTDERCLDLLTVGIIVTDTYHREFPTQR